MGQEKEKQSLSCATNEENISNSHKAANPSDFETVISIPKELVLLDLKESFPTSSGNQVVNDSMDKNMQGKCWVVYDVKCGDDERICRICHLNSEQESKGGSKMVENEIVNLGCGCNGELGFAHLNCAETWFRIKGNRICEICGRMVDNIKGVGNDTFMEEWLESGGPGSTPNTLESNQGCWHGQPFCNFLMACLVIAFVVPWFFHINMF